MELQLLFIDLRIEALNARIPCQWVLVLQRYWQLVPVAAVGLMVEPEVVEVRFGTTHPNHCLEFHQLIFGLAQVEAVESGVVRDLVAVVLQPLNGVGQRNI